MFEKAEDLQSEIEAYFAIATENKKPLSITGLAYHLGFESRQSFYDYESKPEFAYTIKRARLAIEQVYEESLMTKGCVGAIFALKNFGWKDKQEIDLNKNVDFKDAE